MVNALQETMDRAWQVRRTHFADEIVWSIPLDTAVLSLTGGTCALDCAHCGGIYLRSMKPISQALPDGSSSCLISGGCDVSGRVPVLAHLDRVRAWRPGRRMNWHVGLISEVEMAAIADLVDVISFDMVGDDDTIREVYGLDRPVRDWVRTYRMLRQHATTVPHVTIGLRGGRLGHERPAFDLLEEVGTDRLVLLVFVPTPGTRYADRQPPSVEAAAELIAEARVRFPRAELTLGCMRPRGAYRERLDELAVRSGANGVVSPSRRAREVADDLGLVPRTQRECCVFGSPA
jgi:lipoyl synthase